MLVGSHPTHVTDHIKGYALILKEFSFYMVFESI